MRVAFNAQYLLEPRTGTGRYVANLLSALGRVDGINDYVVFTPEPPPQDLAATTPSTFVWEQPRGHASGRGGARFQKGYWEQRVFPRAASQHGARVVHVPHFASSLWTYGIPTVITVHDLANLLIPEYRKRIRARGYAEWVKRAAHKAAAIITPSEFTKGEVIEHLKFEPNRVFVIQEAPAPTFHRVTDPEELARVRARYGLRERYVLNVGGLDARKNIHALVGAFAAAAHEMNDQDIQLFIAGDPTKLDTSPVFPDWRPHAAHWGIAHQVLCQPVAEEDLPALYSGAACFVFTSRYEGFGLTPLEAMACGAPVICLRAAPGKQANALEEVVGAAGMMVRANKADEVDEIGKAMVRVLTDNEVRKDYAARGPVHVRRFSWDRAAAETSSIYAEVTGMRQP